MKIAICFRGLFDIRSILSKEKSISEITSCFEKTIENNKKLFLNKFIIPENKVDYFFSTYDLNKELNSYILKKFNPIIYSFLDKRFATYHERCPPISVGHPSTIPSEKFKFGSISVIFFISNNINPFQM